MLLTLRHACENSYELGFACRPCRMASGRRLSPDSRFPERFMDRPLKELFEDGVFTCRKHARPRPPFCSMTVAVPQVIGGPTKEIARWDRE